MSSTYGIEASCMWLDTRYSGFTGLVYGTGVNPNRNTQHRASKMLCNATTSGGTSSGGWIMNFLPFAMGFARILAIKKSPLATHQMCHHHHSFASKPVSP